MSEYDLVVVGAGSAAREAAARAVEDHGASVALVERERWGGQCPNVACKPTKQYVAAAELYHDLRTVAADLGIEAGTPRFDLAALKARKDWLVGPQEAWLRRFEDAGFHPVAGEASLVDARTVRVGERLLRAERILLATGSRTAVPPVGGIADVPWVDHVGALELTELPRSLLVLGAGAVGLELAQAFARLGSRVTIVEGAERIAIRADEDAAAELHAALADEGIEVVGGTFVTALERRGDTTVATLEPRDGSPQRTIDTELVLVASGRLPNVEALGLEAVGVEHSRAGIAVDERLRTSVPGIWAAGDVTATIQLTPVAAIQAQVAVDDMLGSGMRSARYDALPSTIFTDPELAQVGLTEAEARAQGFDVGTSSYAAGALLRPYYAAAREATPRGLAKLVFERGSRRLLGLHVVARGAGELIQGHAVALRLGATVDDLALGHYAFPTVGEGVHYAAEAALAAERVA
ncbi:MAG TPA: NAD(P)/FAD-dependent oxidoreductase [Gaiellaceae bacterium]|nr:NAD(P)/FAD-dependent oxidoreductase [Gaiellaceae bacterium]